MSKKKKLDSRNVKFTNVASSLEAHATKDLKKAILEELDRPEGWKLTAAELIQLSTTEPLFSIEPPDPQEVEDLERKREAKLIDKMDGGFGAKL